MVDPREARRSDNKSHVIRVRSDNRNDLVEAQSSRLKLRKIYEMQEDQIEFVAAQKIVERIKTHVPEILDRRSRTMVTKKHLTS